MTTFTVDAKDLAAAATFAAQAVASKPIAPAFAGVVLTTDPAAGTLTLSGFDWTRHAVATIPTDSQIAPGDALRVLVHGGMLRDFAGRLSGTVTVTDEDGRVTLKAGRGRFVLTQMDMDRYPDTPGIPSKVGVCDLAGVVGAGVSSASRDTTLPTLQGVRLVAADGTLTAYTTDRYRGTRVAIPWSGEPFAALAPAHALHALLKGYPDGDLTVLADENRLAVQSPDGSRTSSVSILDGEYPDLERLIGVPGPEYATTVTCRRENLLAAIEDAALGADRKAPVQFTFDSDGIKATARTAEGGVESYADADVTGDDITIGLNPSYFVDAVKTVPHPNLILMLAPKKPIRVLSSAEASGEADETVQTILMLVRIPS